MIQFYTNDVGIDLVFPLTDFNGDPLIGDPYVPEGYPKLFVKGLAASPITLEATDTPGSYHHVVSASEWPLSVGEVIHFYECYIEWRDGDQVILSDAFQIAVIKAPSLSLE